MIVFGVLIVLLEREMAIGASEPWRVKTIELDMEVGVMVEAKVKKMGR